MKKNSLLILLACSLFITSCTQNKNKKDSIDEIEVSFPEDDDDEKEPVTPPTATLPNEGDAATDALIFEGNLAHFSNKELHENEELIQAKWNDYGIKMPYVYKFNDTYYLYVSTPELSTGVRAYKSKDLIHWDFADKAGLGMGFVIKDKKSGGAFAPRVLYHNGEFYLYYNNSNGYQLYKGPTPEGPFTFVDSLGDKSSTPGYIYKASHEKFYFFGAGEDGIYVYDMTTDLKVDAKSKTLIEATEKSAFFKGKRTATSPFVITVNGYTYLTYSRTDDDFASYRTYACSAKQLDITNASTVAKSFFNQNQSALMLNTESSRGYTGLGDLCIVEGPDVSRFYGCYTSLKSEGIREFNIDPIYFSDANLTIAPRREDSNGFYTAGYELTDARLSDGKIMSDKITSNYSASMNFTKVKSAYFSYTNSGTNYYLKKNGENIVFGLKENGLDKVITTLPNQEIEYQLKVDAYENYLSVSLNEEPLLINYQSSIPLTGKLGYEVDSDYEIGYTTYSLASHKDVDKNDFKPAEATIYAGMFMDGDKYCNFSSESGLFEETKHNSGFYGSQVLSLAKFKDYARYLVDVKKAGHYGLEMVFNYDFAYCGQNIGLRIGRSDEVIYKTTNIGGSYYVRTLTAEFDVEKGMSEVFIENLSNASFNLVSFRLVETSKTLPSFQNNLKTYSDKGISYLSDFLIGEDMDGGQCTQTYANSNNLAYVGNDCITDFSYSIDVAIGSIPNPDSCIMLGFRLTNWCDSSVDQLDSATGYILAISSNRTNLIRVNYGQSYTLGTYDRTFSTKTYINFNISMFGNKIKITFDDKKMFSLTDDFAVSSGHLAFGTRDALIYFSNVSVTGGND